MDGMIPTPSFPTIKHTRKASKSTKRPEINKPATPNAQAQDAIKSPSTERLLQEFSFVNTGDRLHLTSPPFLERLNNATAEAARRAKGDNN